MFRPAAAARGEHRAGRVAVHERLLAGVGDERGNVLNFTLDRVGLGIAAPPTATSVEVVDGEVRCQLIRQRDVEVMIPKRSTHNDQDRALAGLLVSDVRSVLGYDVLHRRASPRDRGSPVALACLLRLPSTGKLSGRLFDAKPRSSRERAWPSPTVEHLLCREA